MDFIDKYYTRQFHDYFAIIVHTTVIAATLGNKPHFANTPEGALAVAQEAITIAFHIVYAYNYAEKNLAGSANRLKWFEYAVTATIGTIATLLTGTHTTPWYWITFIIVAGIGQQSAGYRIDTDNNTKASTTDWITYTFAAALQAAELTVIWAAQTPWRIAITYSIGWSAFGIHAAIRLANKTNTQSNWSNTDWTETVYSTLSWTAKLAVYIAIYTENTTNNTQTKNITLVATIIAYTAFITPAITRSQTTPHPNRF